LLESIYEDALCIELELVGLKHQRQAMLKTTYKGYELSPQRLDILVENEVVVELKSLSKMADAHTAQVLSYLKATGLKRGLLINFGEQRLIDGVKRISH
jgi:GxxExxY protein